jgi:hypothetical protein
LGRSGLVKIAHRRSGVRWAQGIPAGFPWGMAGKGEEIDGAIQQAPHPARQGVGGLASSRLSTSLTIRAGVVYTRSPSQAAPMAGIFCNRLARPRF